MQSNNTGIYAVIYERQEHFAGTISHSLANKKATTMHQYVLKSHIMQCIVISHASVIHFTGHFTGSINNKRNLTKLALVGKLYNLFTPVVYEPIFLGHFIGSNSHSLG
jgi:hypothetical protein